MPWVSTLKSSPTPPPPPPPPPPTPMVQGRSQKKGKGGGGGGLSYACSGIDLTWRPCNTASGSRKTPPHPDTAEQALQLSPCFELQTKLVACMRKIIFKRGGGGGGGGFGPYSPPPPLPMVARESYTFAAVYSSNMQEIQHRDGMLPVQCYQ